MKPIQLFSYDDKYKSEIIKFHPKSPSLIINSLSDHSMNICDIDNGKNIISFNRDSNNSINNSCTDSIFSIQWSHDGDLLLTSCKDKYIRLFDPRNSNKAISVF